jgi:hypothetical protein
LLFLGALGPYALFPTQTYYWDGILFSIYVEQVSRGAAPLAVLFHANHLLYSSLGYCFFEALRACGIAVRALAAFQILNMVVSALSGCMVFNLARSITKSSLVSFFCWTLFTFGATWWKFSTDADSYIVTVFMLLLASQYLLSGTFKVVRVGVFHVSAMLFHELAIFFYIPVFTAILLNRYWPRHKLMWAFAGYATVTAGCVTVIYWIAYQSADHVAFPTLLSWITSRSSDTQATHSTKQIVGYFFSFAKLFAGGKISLIKQFFGPVILVFLGASLLLTALAIYFFRKPRVEIAEVDQAPIAILWAWLLPSAIFLGSWDPASTFHKLLIWAPIVLLLGAYIAKRNALSSRARGFVAVSAAFAAWNFGAFAYPHSKTSVDPVLALALRLNRELPRDAVVYYSLLNADDWYLEYFAPGRTWTRLPSNLSLPPAKNSAPVCLETTALDQIAGDPRVKLDIDPHRRWDLVNKQHNVRLECLKPF